MMSIELWREWIFPRLKKVIDAAKNIKPDILIQYHSCGYIEPFIPHLLEPEVPYENVVAYIKACKDFRP